jgi:hypothetical protein
MINLKNHIFQKKKEKKKKKEAIPHFSATYLQYQLQYQIRARISPEITCKDNFSNSNNIISTLQEMLKNQILNKKYMKFPSIGHDDCEFPKV